jgi:hypothetical protein
MAAYAWMLVQENGHKWAQQPGTSTPARSDNPVFRHPAAEVLASVVGEVRGAWQWIPELVGYRQEGSSRQVLLLVITNLASRCARGSCQTATGLNPCRR